MSPKAHAEKHRNGRSGWMRAAILGSNDAIVSTASLMIGVAASSASRHAILVAGVAALVAGALSMAVGEYVSVSSQRDMERAEIAKEKRELAAQPRAELAELAGIYVRRGLDPALAAQVAEQLSAHDRLGAHLRDELHIHPQDSPRPLQAAAASAASFAFFSTIPIVALLIAPTALRLPLIGVISLASLSSLGALGAYLGGAPILRATLRVTIGGVLAMAISAGIGRLLGVSTG